MKFNKYFILLFLIFLSCREDIVDTSRFDHKDEKFNKARQYYIERNFVQSARWLEKVELKTDVIQYLRAKNYFYLKEYEKAVHFFTNINDPVLTPYKDIYLGQSYSYLQMTNRALDSFLKAYRSEYLIHRIKSAFLLADLYRNMDNDSAIPYFEFIIANYRNLRYNWKVKSFFLGRRIVEESFTNLAVIYEKKKDYNRVLSVSTRILQGPYSARGKKWVAIKLKELFNAQKIQTHNRHYLFIIAREFYYRGWKQSAKKYFEQIVQYDKNINSSYKLKSLYFLGIIEKDNYSLARSYLDKARTEYRSSPLSLYYTAKFYQVSGKMDEAIAILNDLVKSDKKIRIISFLTLIDIYNSLKQKEKETEIIKKFFNTFPSVKEACEKLYYMALETYIQGETDEAEKCFKMLLKGKFYRNRARFFLGDIAFKRKDFKGSFTYLSKYLEQSRLNYFYIEAEKMIARMPDKKEELERRHRYFFNRVKEKFSRKEVEHLIFGESNGKYEKDKEFQRMELFMKNGLTLEGDIHLQNLEESCREERIDLYKFLLNWFIDNKIPYYVLNYRLRLINSLKLAKALLQVPLRVREFIFPWYYEDHINSILKKYNIEKALIFALMREESVFNIEALSPANAQGVFQVIPSTAELIIKKSNIRLGDDTIFNITKNAEIGIWYLDTLLKKYKDDYILPLAAYNAGSRRVDQWVKKFNYDENTKYAFIELIPFRETKYYVKKVMFSFHFYKRTTGESDGVN
ncbi:MAG: transglycosylase SLT domain-containing protein [Spirochaetes bacterium]|nr:transglycosylase SLT domain-containing protein [Spirochaetota bacterium]